MGEFFDKLRTADDELNVLDRIVVIAIGKLLFEPFEEQLASELWPEAEPMIEGTEVGELLNLAYDRESAAEARNAHNAATFWIYVTDRLLRMIEETVARKSNEGDLDSGSQ